DRPAGLVRLQRSNEVPRRARRGGSLLDGLLDPVLAQSVKAGRDRGADAFGRNRLRDRDEPDLARIAPDSLRRGLDPSDHARASARQLVTLDRIDQRVTPGRSAGCMARRRLAAETSAP